MSVPKPTTEAGSAEAFKPGPAVDPLIDIKSIALWLGCPRETVETMRQAGKFPPPDCRLGLTGRALRWRRSTVDRWIDAGGVK